MTFPKDVHTYLSPIVLKDKDVDTLLKSILKAMANIEVGFQLTKENYQKNPQNL